jgi:hypothetical protein
VVDRRHALLAGLCLVIACRKADWNRSIPAHLTKNLAELWGITAKVTCPKIFREPEIDDVIPCTAAPADGEPLDLSYRITGKGGMGTLVVRNGPLVYLPVKRFVPRLRYEAPELEPRCGQPYVAVHPDKPSYCDLYKAGAPAKRLRIELEDPVKEKWRMRIVDLPR